MSDLAQPKVAVPDLAARAQALADAASPGPWEAQEVAFAPGLGPARVKGLPMVIREDTRQACLKNVADAEFIAASRELVPELAARVNELEAQVAQYHDTITELAPSIPVIQLKMQRLEEQNEQLAGRCASLDAELRSAVTSVQKLLRDSDFATGHVSAEALNELEAFALFVDVDNIPCLPN